MILGRIALSMFMVLAIWSFSAQADVTGSFSLSVSLIPDGDQTEAQKMDIDLRTNLQLMITISGLSFGTQSLFGTFGLEENLMTLSTNIGALTVRDELFFSIPYYVAAPGGFMGGQLSQIIHPTINSDGDRNGLGFVQKKITAEMNIAGLTITNISLFEDVDFPGVFNNFNPVYNLDKVDSIIGNQTPTFGFGDILRVSGQTVSGITVSGATYLCAENFGKSFKSKSLNYSVNPTCTAQFGRDDREPLEEGAKTPLLFDGVTMSIERLEVGGVRLDASLEFSPNFPLAFFLQSSFSLFDTLHVLGGFLFIDFLDFARYQFIVSTFDLLQGFDDSERFVTNGVEIVVQDFDGDLVPDTTSALFATILNPNQNPAWFATSVSLEDPDGLTGAFLILAIERGPLALETATTLRRTIFTPSANGLDWQDTSFSLSFEPPHSDLMLTLRSQFSIYSLPIFSLELEFDYGLGFLSDIQFPGGQVI